MSCGCVWQGPGADAGGLGSEPVYTHVAVAAFEEAVAEVLGGVRPHDARTAPFPGSKRCCDDYHAACEVWCRRDGAFHHDWAVGAVAGCEAGVEAEGSGLGTPHPGESKS